jgi:hypothetical protein
MDQWAKEVQEVVYGEWNHHERGDEPFRVDLLDLELPLLFPCTLHIVSECTRTNLDVEEAAVKDLWFMSIVAGRRPRARLAPWRKRISGLGTTQSLPEAIACLLFYFLDFPRDLVNRRTALCDSISRCTASEPVMEPYHTPRMTRRNGV